MRIEDLDLFEPGVALAILAFIDEKLGLVWFMAKLLLMIYLVTYIKKAAEEMMKGKKKKPKEIPQPSEEQEVTSIMRGTPAYPDIKRDPFGFLDDKNKSRR